MKKWKCTVCGYIHTGEEPPEECPVCGADKSAFIEITDEAPESETSREKPASEAKAAPGEPTSEPGPAEPSPEEAPPAPTPEEKRRDLLVKYHVHPISVHIPNGVAPISAFFVLLAVLFGCPYLEIAALCNMVLVLLTMPAVLYTGYISWRHKYKGARTDLFFNKILCAGFVTLLSLVIVMWWIIDPTVASTGGDGRWIFLILNGLLVAFGAAAGWLGGKLVFKDA